VKHQTGGDFQTGGFLKEPGTYHFIITGMEETPTKRDGSMIDNAAFRIALEALDGTFAGCKGKTCDMIFFHPKPGGKNDGAFARKKMDRFFLAVGLISDDDKDKEVDIDLNLAVGRQFVAKMELDDDGKFLQLSFADIFHVDDPSVGQVPKCKESLAIIAPSLRRIGEQPKKDKGGKDKPATGAKKEEKKGPTKPVDEEFDL
jgi:hypothetical protein